MSCLISSQSKSLHSRSIIVSSLFSFLSTMFFLSEFQIVGSCCHWWLSFIIDLDPWYYGGYWRFFVRIVMVLSISVPLIMEVYVVDVLWCVWWRLLQVVVIDVQCIWLYGWECSLLWMSTFLVLMYTFSILRWWCWCVEEQWWWLQRWYHDDIIF